MTDAATLPPPSPPENPRLLRIGVSLASAAVVMLLGALLAAYYAFRDATGAADWPPEAATIPNVPVAVTTVTLLMSSVTLEWARWSSRRGDRRHALVGLGVTLVLGLAFVNGMTFAWESLGVGVADAPYGTLVLATTGTYVALLAVALTALAVVGFRALGGQVGPVNTEPLTAVGIGWHTLVLLWVVVYWSLYLLT